MHTRPESGGEGGVSAEIKALQLEIEHLKEERAHTADRIAASMRLSAIGQMAAGIAHELNNPLSVILGFSQSLAVRLEGQASIYTPLKTMEREALRCKRVIQDLLTFSRLPKPGRVMENMVEVLEGALTLIETQSRIKNVEIVRDFSEELPPVYLDRHRFQQLIINLCLNAIDAMPKGGKITIRAALADEARTPSGVEVSVSDTGTGIPPAIRQKIFEPFFTTKEKGKGTGLGLSLAREIVEEHEGRLEVVSKLAEGTTFTIRLAAGARNPAPIPKAKHL